MHQLVGDNLIWLSLDRRQVHVLSLRSLVSKTLMCDTRESIGDICAADELVAFTAQHKGVIFVGELNGQGTVKKFRFMNAGQSFVLTCRRRMVACASHQRDHTFVYIWNFDNQQGRSFRVDRDTLHIPMKSGGNLGLLLQPDMGTVILCQSTSVLSENGVGRTKTVSWQFTYAGECLHSVEQELEDFSDANVALVYGDWTGIRFIPASYDGLFMMLCCVRHSGFLTNSVYKYEFDERLQTFASPQHPNVYLTNIHKGNVVWWKDNFVGANTEEPTIVHMGTVSDPRRDLLVSFDPSTPKRRGPRDWQPTWQDVLINNRWIVRSYDDVFYILCYDHTVELPGKEGVLDGVGPWETIHPKFASAS